MMLSAFERTRGVKLRSMQYALTRLRCSPAIGRWISIAASDLAAAVAHGKAAGREAEARADKASAETREVNARLAKLQAELNALRADAQARDAELRALREQQPQSQRGGGGATRPR